MKLTSSMLHGGMERDDETFAQEWPDGVELTEQVFVRMIELGIDVDQIVHQIMPPVIFGRLERLVARLEERKRDQCRPAWKIYYDALAPYRQALDEKEQEAKRILDAATSETVESIERTIGAVKWAAIQPFLKLIGDDEEKP